MAECYNDLVAIDYDGTTYSLTEGPTKDSRFVIEAYENLNQTLLINEFAADLANVGKFLLMIQCSLMGHIQLEISFRERLHSVVKLCDDTVHTFSEFDRVSSDTISNIATAFEYLIEGFEEITLETLVDVQENAKIIEKESYRLQKRFGDELSEVEMLLEQTMIERKQVNAETLQHAVVAIRNLSDIMRIAVNFWRETYSVGTSINQHNFIKMLDRILGVVEEKRKKLWKSKVFKMKVINFYAQWIAVQQMCSMSRALLTNSQRQVHMFIRQNLTKEQAKELLEMLAGELHIQILTVNPSNL